MALDWNADGTLDVAYYERKAATDPMYRYTGALGAVLHQIGNDMFDADPTTPDFGYPEGGEEGSTWWVLIVPAEYFEGYEGGVPAFLTATAYIMQEHDGVVFVDTFDDADHAERSFREMR